MSLFKWEGASVSSSSGTTACAVRRGFAIVLMVAVLFVGASSCQSQLTRCSDPGGCKLPLVCHQKTNVCWWPQEDGGSDGGSPKAVDGGEEAGGDGGDSPATVDGGVDTARASDAGALVSDAGLGDAGASEGGLLAPSNLHYQAEAPAYTKGVAIPANGPSSGGGRVGTYTVYPVLPAGLSLDPSSGVISGTPLVLSPRAGYTVTASNSSGSSTVVLFIVVNDVPPTSLAYTANPIAGVSTYPLPSSAPTSSGGPVGTYAVEPGLPPGLRFDPQTGVVSGTPTGGAGQSSHTVTAKNSGGSATTKLEVVIRAPPTPDGKVYALASGPDGTTYLGGYFSHVGGLSRGGLAAIDPTGKVTAWNPPPVNGGIVRAIAVHGTTIYVGGSFSAIGTVTRNRLAAIDALGTVMPWDPGADYDATAIVANAGVAYVGGLAPISAAKRNFLAAIDSSGAASTWNPDPNGSVRALAISGSTLYVGGSFTSIGGAFRNRVAAVNLSTGAVGSWDPGLDGSVNAISVSGTTIYLGGSFSTVGTQARRNLAAVDWTGRVTEWDPSADSEVLALGASGDSIYVGGHFNAVGGEVRKYGAAVTAKGTVLPWAPEFSYLVRAVLVGDGFVLLGGDFDTPTPYLLRVPR